LKEQVGPKSFFNGSMIADYFRTQFSMTKREAVALMGAHGFGAPRGASSGGFRYDWTHKQTRELNNVYYRIISLMPSKHFERGQQWGAKIPASAVGGVGGTDGGVNGAMAETRMFLHVEGKEAGGGHYQWFHGYQRCPFCHKGKNLDRHRGSYGPAPGVISDRCCELCAKATKAVVITDKGQTDQMYELEGLTEAESEDFTKHKCLHYSNVHETALTADIALHRKINIAEGGRPLNNNFGAFPGGFIYPGDAVNTLKDSDDPLSMHEIVELYANDQNRWAQDFASVLEKMLTNGVHDELVESFALGPDVSCVEPAKRTLPFICSRNR
jgi:hypothetical protein